VAHRTSPTNMGLLLLSALAAHDLGYVSLRALLRRLERVFDTFSRMERYRGHLYNWYDTRTLKPLVPVYVSTGGQRQPARLPSRLEARPARKDRGTACRRRTGAGDSTTRSTWPAEALQDMTSRSGVAAVDVLRLLEEDVRALRQLLRETPSDLLAWQAWLKHLDERTSAMRDRVRALGIELREIPRTWSAGRAACTNRPATCAASWTRSLPGWNCFRVIHRFALASAKPMNHWKRWGGAAPATVQTGEPGRRAGSSGDDPQGTGGAGENLAGGRPPAGLRRHRRRRALDRRRRPARPLPASGGPGQHAGPRDGLHGAVQRATATSSRSATTWRPAGSTPLITICSPRRRVWRASWRSRAARRRGGTGSSSADP